MAEALRRLDCTTAGKRVKRHNINSSINPPVKACEISTPAAPEGHTSMV